MNFVLHWFQRGKGRDHVTQSYHKIPYTRRKIQNTRRQHKTATKIFDNTTMANRLRTISWGIVSHLTGVVKQVIGTPTFPLTAKAVKSKRHTFKYY